MATYVPWLLYHVMHFTSGSSSSAGYSSAVVLNKRWIQDEQSGYPGPQDLRTLAFQVHKLLGATTPLNVNLECAGQFKWIHSAPSLMQTRLYAHHRSSFVKIEGPERLSRAVLVSGCGCLFFDIRMETPVFFLNEELCSRWKGGWWDGNWL